MKSIRYIFSAILLLLGASYASAQTTTYGCWGPVMVNGISYSHPVEFRKVELLKLE